MEFIQDLIFFHSCMCVPNERGTDANANLNNWQNFLNLRTAILSDMFRKGASYKYLQVAFAYLVLQTSICKRNSLRFFRGVPSSSNSKVFCISCKR